MTRALIYCAGVGERWARGWPDGQPKQLAVVEGEPVLHRTCRQLTERNVEPVVVAFDERLSVSSAQFWRPPEPTRWLVETIGTSESLCDDQRAIGLFGDCWFSDHAMDVICTSSGLQFFGRVRGSVLTGGPAECFGFGFDAADRSRFFDAVRAGIADAAEKDAGVHGSPTEPGSIWQPYRKLCGLDMYEHRCPSHWVEIDDWTDDFDTPERYERWLTRFERRWVGDSG